MTPQLHLRLLGTVSIQLDGEPVTGLPSRAAEGLLIYLACHDRPLAREHLAELFWADRSQKQALTNLRTILTALRRELGDYLVVTRQTLAFNHEADVWLDRAEFERKMTKVDIHEAPAAELTPETARNLDAALDLYGGDFLDGFYLPEGLGFEEWSLVTRERLRRLASDGLRRLAAHFLANADYPAGIQAANRLLAIDPFDEDAQRMMMWLFARSGQPNSAIRQFKDLQALLNDELGVEPARATRALVERIRTIQFPPPNNLPASPSLIIGRKREIKEVSARLAIPNFRLLTIFGPGGIGKTRLAIEIGRMIAEARPGQFLNGVYFVPLTGLQAPEFLLTSIADAMGIELQSSEPPVAQLIAHLHEKELLLILDNFEQLLPVVGKGTAKPGGGALLARLLQDLPALKMIVTSRERLNLYEEIVYEVPGLDVPETGVEDPEGFSAVRLFCETARQKNSAFGPSPDELPEIVRACQILEGVPLAIELASDWVRLFSCAQIVKEIERNLDILTTTIQNVPERHRSLRAVFLHSWDLLAEDEQAVYRKLSVFRSGFTLEAAEQVAEADRSALLKLVDKSLVRQSAVDRYEIHELLRQYAEEQLDSDPELRDEVKSAHANYYTGLLQALDPGRGQPSQGEVVSAAARDLSNIRHAWEWALNKEIFPALEHGLTGVATFYLLKGPLLEGENLLKATVERLRATEQKDSLFGRLLCISLAYQARFRIWQGKYEGVIAVSREAIRLARQHDVTAAEILGKLCWGEVEWHQGAYEKAERQYKDSLALARGAELRYLEAESLRFLGQASWPQGDYPQANVYYQQALVIYRQIGDVNGETMTLNYLGVIAFEQDDYTQARLFIERAAEVNREMGNLLGEGKILTNLCVMCCFQGDFEQAAAHNARALKILDEVGERAGYAANLRNRGMIDVYLGAFESAEAAQNRALTLFRAIGDRRGEGYALAGLSNLYHQWGKDGLSRELAEQALSIARELEINFSATKALTFLGNALMASGRTADAARAYEEACSLAIEARQPVLTMEALAGLARIALAENDLDLARERVSTILLELNKRTPEGAAEPSRIYLTCHRVLAVCGDPDHQTILNHGYRLLQQQANKIDDRDTKRSFLKNVPANRDLVQAYEESSD